MKALYFMRFIIYGFIHGQIITLMEWLFAFRLNPLLFFLTVIVFLIPTIYLDNKYIKGKY